MVAGAYDVDGRAAGGHRAQIAAEETVAMIRVEAAGRMGNQMFQLAFAHAASRRLGTTFVHRRPPFKVDDIGLPLWRFFDLGVWGTKSTRLARQVAFATRHRRTPVRMVGQQERPEDVLADLRDETIYQGFFQSERWFAGFEHEIRGLFEPRPVHRAAFEQYRRTTPYVCMHVRRTDYIQTRVWALPTSFFHDALDAVENLGRYDIVVVTDDAPFVRREFASTHRIVCESRPAMVDLQLLTHADVVITSNSSFSWWGAWLNSSSDGRVIAPNHWLGFAARAEEPASVIPTRWSTVAVRDSPLGA